MKYRLALQMDISVIDEKYPSIMKNRRKKPIGNPTTIIGTEEEILDKINEMVKNLLNLATDIYIEGEENVTIKG